MSQKYFIAVAGNMGVGKSTLTSLLVNVFDGIPCYEAVDDNPYLTDFYQDMRQWSFHSQIFFLTSRLRSHREILGHPRTVIQDRSIYEDAEIFARNLYQRGNMSDRDFNVYRSLYQEFIQFLSAPDLIIYLKASVPTLIERILRRGRDFEQDVSPLYLQQLNELYDAWIEDFTLCPVLTVDADRLDFVRFDADFDFIRENILKKLGRREKVYVR